MGKVKYLAIAQWNVRGQEEKMKDNDFVGNKVNQKH